MVPLSFLHERDLIEHAAATLARDNSATILVGPPRISGARFVVDILGVDDGAPFLT
jgi:hypothetical protein